MSCLLCIIKVKLMKSFIKPAIKLRGHHLICLHFFKGEGYSPEFVTNLKEILRRVEAGVEIEVYSGADDVCKMCPYLKVEMCFYAKDAEAGIREMDKRAIELLGVKDHERVKWIDVKKKIPEIFREWAREYCKVCNWRKVCERGPEYRRIKEGLAV
jgi:hypothetical protein